MIENRAWDQDGQSELFMYCLQLLEKHEETNMFNKIPYVSFLNVSMSTFNKVGKGKFNPRDLTLEGECSEKVTAQNTVTKVAKVLVKQNYVQIRKNLSNCAKAILTEKANRKFKVFRNEWNDSLFVLNQS